MFLGNILDEKSGISGSYTYRQRGTAIPSFPDLFPDIIQVKSTDDVKPEDCYISFKEGNLFNKRTIGWKWLTLLDTGVDIFIKLSSRCFIDNIKIKQGAGSAVKSVRVLSTGENGDPGVIGRIDAATDSMLAAEQLEISVGVFARDIIIRLDANFSDIIIEDVNILGAVFDKYTLYPMPESTSIDESSLIDMANLERIIISSSASSDTVFAANLLKEKIIENHNIELPVESCSKNVRASANSIFLGKSGEIDIIDSAITETPAKEGYIINSDASAVYIKASDRLGLVYGVETLLSLMNNGQIPKCTIKDTPFMEFRGVHFGLPSREEIPFFKRLVRYCLAPMRINTIFLEFAGGMRFDRHPKISEAWLEGNRKAREGKWPPFPHGHIVASGTILEKSEVAEIVEYARSYGFEIIPEVQSLGHVQYITVAYPEVAETEPSDYDTSNVDLKKEDMPPSKFYKNSYCTMNNKIYSIIFDLIDEIVEVVRPTRYVHMGHDEVYNIGTCPVCSKLDPAELYAMDVNKLYNYLRSKNLGMMIWGDMLQDCTEYKTPPAITKIPKDIILLDFIWYFHPDKDIEDHLLDHGFKVIMGNMYSSHYPRFEARARKKGIIGAEVSVWKQLTEYHLGFEGKIYDFVYSANMMWSSEYRSDLRLCYDHIISKLMPHLRSRLHGEKYPSLSKTRKCMPVSLPGAENCPPIPCGLATAVKKLGNTELKGIPFDLNNIVSVISKAAGGDKYCECVTIPVNLTCDSLIFLHSTAENEKRIPWRNPVQVGVYIIEYRDGTILEVPVEYGGNAGVWNRRYAAPMKHGFYRHQGYVATYLSDAYIQSKTQDGKDITVYGYEWINPDKDKEISKITLKASGNSDSQVILFAITGIRE
ncbi:MAG TPA: family 20 glycosylhydrolase [Clostridiaceae bacterium]|nr:family 20 glycosylhydrolase [Clostridiaceae bacterium]